MAKEKSVFTLTQAKTVSKNFILFGGVGLVVFLVFWFASGAFIRYWIATHPEPPPPPTVGFGILPPPVFPATPDENKPSKYILETPTGRLPEFSDRALVFFMPKNSPGLLDAEKAKQFATKLNFVFEPEIIDSRTYRWQRTQPLFTTIEYDIQDHVFSYQSDFANRPELLLDSELPTKFDAISEVKAFLQSAIDLQPDIATASGSFAFVKSVGAELIPAVAVTDADFVTVDINRAPVDGQYEMYTDRDGQGVIHALVGNIKNIGNILQLDYYYYPIDYSVIHTYPLRPVKQAWEILQGGEGYISHPIKSEQATIRQVSLGYYDSTAPQMYLQPIYVFSGDDGFLGYVSALDPTYLNTTQAETP